MASAAGAGGWMWRCSSVWLDGICGQVVAGRKRLPGPARVGGLHMAALGDFTAFQLPWKSL